MLDYTDIAAFDGDAEEFYDGAHITVENSRLLLSKAVEEAPECFR